MNSRKHFINPYQLLNVKPSSSIQELKKAYRELALLCHPDKNGVDKDMIMVQNAYEYVRKEIEFGANRLSYEDAESSFKNFCDNQVNAEKPFPDLADIIHDTHEYTKKFNAIFDENLKDESHFPMSYPSGYGDNMVKNEIIDNTEDVNKSDPFKPLNDNQRFKKKLIVYDEPVAAFVNGISSEFDYKMKECSDYTDYNNAGGDSSGADYRLAFAEKTPEEVQFDSLNHNAYLDDELITDYKKGMYSLKEFLADNKLDTITSSSDNVENNDVNDINDINVKTDVKTELEDSNDDEDNDELKNLYDDMVKQRDDVDKVVSESRDKDNTESGIDKILNLRKQNELNKMTGETPEDDDFLFIEKDM